MLATAAHATPASEASSTTLLGAMKAEKTFDDMFANLDLIMRQTSMTAMQIHMGPLMARMKSAIAQVGEEAKAAKK